jgi:hypothetical protein
MPRLLLHLIVPGLALLLSACSPERAVRMVATPAADSLARDFIQQLRRGDPAAARRLAPELLGIEGMQDSLRNVTRIFPRGPVRETELVNAAVFAEQGRTTRRLLYQEEAAGGWALVEVVILEDAMKYRYIAGVRVTPTQGRIQDANALDFSGTGPAHWIMLALMAGVLLFCVASAVRVARTPMPRRWLWAMLALLAAGKLTLNWATGELSVTPINLQLLGAGAFRSGLGGPWLLSVALPVGAIMALSKRRRFLAQRNAAPPEEPPPAPGAVAE